jgi:pyruvate carboxylase subunit B
MFQSPFFYSNENSFDVMDAFRKATGPDADLQSLARGIHRVALEAQPRGMIKLCAEALGGRGVTTNRNYDAFNAPENLNWTGQCIQGAGLKHEVSITMMEPTPGSSGIHTVASYERILRKILESGVQFDSICYKDSSGSVRPRNVFETIRMARGILGTGVKIAFHTHNTAGTSVLANMSAIEAGVDQIDLSLAPVSGGTSQLDVLTMWHALKGTAYSLDINAPKIIELEEMFKEAMKGYFLPPESMRVDPLIPLIPMPGGALTANTQMLRDNDLLGRYPEVIAAMSEVVNKGGHGTAVTPVSQFYFQQAFNNVMFGPWNKIAAGYGKMVLGYYGKTPVPPDAEVVRIAMEQLKLQPSTNHLHEIEQDPEKGVAAATAVLKQEKLPVTDENILIVATCEEKGVAFLKGQGTIGVRKSSQVRPAGMVPAAVAVPAFSSAPSVCNVVINGNDYRIVLDGTNALVNGSMYNVAITEPGAESQPAPMVSPEFSAPAAAESATRPAAAPVRPAPAAATAPARSGPSDVGQPLVTQLPGLVVRIDKQVGAAVKVGDTVLTVESMKMENAVTATANGTISAIHVKQGDFVNDGQQVAMIS